MNTRLVGSKTMVVILTPLSGPKEVTCLHPTKQYSNRIGNLWIIHVLVISALRFSCSVLCPCSVITLRIEIIFFFKFKLAIFSLSTYYGRWHGNITVKIHNTLQFTLHRVWKLNVSPAKLTWNGQLIISLFTLKIIMDVCSFNYKGKITVQIDNTMQFAHISKKLNVSLAKLTWNG